MFTFGAKGVVIIAAVITNINIIAILVDSKRNFVGKEVFVALIAEQVFIRKATGANIGTVMDHSHLAFIMVFLAVLTEAVIFVKAMVADLDTFAVTVEDFPSFRRIIFAFLTEFAIIVVTVLAKELRIKFAGARNAKPVSPNFENLEIVLMVVANGNFGVEIRMRPVSITAKTVTARNVNAMFITAIFFSLPEIGHAFKLRKFTLNKVTIKFRFSLSPTGTAMRVVEATLKQKPVVRFIHEELTCGLAIVERFGFIRVGGSKNDESHVVTSVTSAPTIIFAIENVEGMAGSQSRAAIIPFGI